MSDFRDLCELFREYLHRNEAIELKLANLDTKLDVITNTVISTGKEIIKTMTDNETKILAAIDTATNRISDDIKRIVEVINSLSPSDPAFETQLGAQVTKLSGVADSLDAVGKTAPPVDTPPGV